MRRAASIIKAVPGLTPAIQLQAVLSKARERALGGSTVNGSNCDDFLDIRAWDRAPLL